MKKYKLLLVQHFQDDFSFIKSVNPNYFTEYSIGDNRYLVSKRKYTVVGQEEEEMKVIYRTLDKDSMYMLFEDYWIFMGAFDDDMNEVLSDPVEGKEFSEHYYRDDKKERIQKRINMIRKYKR
jgi:hypothetical protein